MPDDLRDYRLRIDMTFPPEAKVYADELQEVLTRLYKYAVRINEGADNEEVGYIWLERCGHRLGLPCTTIKKVEI